MIIDLPTFTLIHVVLSLVGIVAGLVVVGGLMAGVRFDGWTGVYFVTTVFALYLNVFVLVAQLFQKIPAMIALAPTQSAPAFVVTHLIVLALFVVLGRAAMRGFRAERVAMVR